MALVVETGARVTGANTFIGVDDADAYFSARNMTTWTGTDAAKEAALIRAGQYLNGLKWLGYRIAYNQAMCWPRLDVPIDDVGVPESYDISEGYYWPSNEIPGAILQAQCEVALRYLVGTDMLPDLDRGGMIASATGGPASVTYMAGAPGGTVFQAVNVLLRPFLRPSGGLTMVRG